ncbi:hypothetical protein Dsin_021455 [Dipteronia sinensis]|uniref:Uncharacterized protein n=1 Tax=Dipteronia sinensis TaxID=43782 RepID=A0AAE0DYU6_9ROSI|nr:hypothetical protein Dsin_021455 [Dipteronia sinensis]
MYVNDNEGAKSRSEFLTKLQKLLPPSIVIPEKRLEHLVESALDVQQDSCAFHNTLDSDLSLYSNHRCGRNRIPSPTLQVREHYGWLLFTSDSLHGPHLFLSFLIGYKWH